MQSASPTPRGAPRASRVPPGPPAATPPNDRPNAPHPNPVEFVHTSRRWGWTRPGWIQEAQAGGGGGGRSRLSRWTRRRRQRVAARATRSVHAPAQDIPPPWTPAGRGGRPGPPTDPDGRPTDGLQSDGQGKSLERDDRQHAVFMLPRLARRAPRTRRRDSAAPVAPRARSCSFRTADSASARVPFADRKGRRVSCEPPRPATVLSAESAGKPTRACELRGRQPRHAPERCTRLAAYPAGAPTPFPPRALAPGYFPVRAPVLQCGRWGNNLDLFRFLVHWG